MSQAPPAPPVIPDYELIRLVGRGAYGDVWLARGVTGVFRAIKIVWRERFENAEPYEREFRGLKQFAAISILESRQLALLHVGRLDHAGCFYYVMEPADDAETGREIDPDRYVPNTLKELRARRGRLLAPEAVALGADLSRALAGLHARGLVHRDIKPSNIILVGGAPKLADVGLVTTATEARTFVGTEGYVPPEGPGTPAADVYAMGRVLYEVATGRDGRDFPTLPPNFNLLPDRRELLELNEVIVRACEPDATQRHRDAAAVLDDLLLLQAGKSVRRLRSAERHLTRALRATVILAIAAAVAGAGAWIAQRRADREMALREKAEAERDAENRRATYSANLARAQSALENDELAQARQLLDALRPKVGAEDLRGLEWRILWQKAQGAPRTVLRSAGKISSAALQLSPDEALLAVHDKSDTVVLYDAVTRREKGRLGGIRKFAGFSPDSQWVWGADPGGVTRRWSVATGEAEEAESIGDPFAVSSDYVFAISDGPTLELRLHPSRRGSNPRRATIGQQEAGNPWSNYRSTLGADGKIVVHVWRRGAGSDAEFRLVACTIGATELVYSQDLGRVVPTGIGVDHLGAWAACRDPAKENSDQLWRCRENGWSLAPDGLPPDTRKYVEFSRDNERLALVARGRQLIWLADPQSPAFPRVARGHDALITDFAISPRHDCVFSTSSDGSVVCWPLAGPPQSRLQAWPTLGATNVVFTPDGKTLWVPKGGGTCALLDAAKLIELTHVHGMIYPVAVAGDTLIGVGSESGLLRVKAETGELLESMMESARPARMGAISSDGKVAALLDQAGRVLAPEGRRTKAVDLPSLQRPYLIALDPGGTRLIMASSLPRPLLTCLSWPDGRKLWEDAEIPMMSSIRFVPNQNAFVVALENGLLQRRTVERGMVPVDAVNSGCAPPQTIAFSADGQRLFVGGSHGEIHCFAVNPWRAVHVLATGQDQDITRIVSSPDGRTLAVLATNGRLELLRTD